MTKTEVAFCIVLAVVVSLVLLMGSGRPIDINFTSNDLKELCKPYAIPYPERERKREKEEQNTEEKSKKTLEYEGNNPQEAEG